MAVIQNQQKCEDPQARFNTYGYNFERIAQEVAAIPQEVGRDLNMAPDRYRLLEVGGLRAGFADCPEMDKMGQECDVDLKQLRTD